MSAPRRFNQRVAEYHGRQFGVLHDNRENPSQVLLETFTGDDVSALDGFAPAPTAWVDFRGVADRYQRMVDKSELDALYSEALYFSWRGKPFVRCGLDEQAGTVYGEYDGKDLSWVKENGLPVEQYGMVWGVFAIDEVQDLHIVRNDELKGIKERRDL